MTNDPYKGMVVTYNFLNLPTRMLFGNAFTGTKTIDVLYDASGRKLRKTVTDGTTLQYRQDLDLLRWRPIGCNRNKS
jgi:YD repeat-containing protein